MSELRRVCDTCKHNPPSKKWPCLDCDMREPADRWEPKELDTISRQKALDALGEEPYVWEEDDDFTRGMRYQWKRKSIMMQSRRYHPYSRNVQRVRREKNETP